MQDSDPHKQPQDTRSDGLHDRLGHGRNGQPQTAAQPPSASLPTEARLHSLFRAAPIAICLVSNRVLLEVNDRMCEMVGYSREELLGRDARILYPSDKDYDYVGTVEYGQIQERGTGAVETRWRHKDGTVIDILLSSAVLNPDDLSQGITFTAIDITARKKAEGGLRESERRYRETASLLETLLNAIPDVIGLQDAKHHIIRYNAAGYAFLHISPDEVHGQRCFELIGQDRPCEVCATSEVYRTKKPAQVEKYSQEMDMWLDVRAYPVLDDSGQITNVIEHLRDITSQKRAQKALEDSEARYRAVVEDQTEFICRFRPDGRITFANEALCRFHGQSREDVIGKNFSTWMTPEEHRQLWRCLEALTPEHPVITHENRGILPGGQEFWGQWTNHAIFDEAGKVTEYQGVGRDITEQKRAEQALRESEIRFRELAELLPQTVFETDAEGRFTFVNRLACESFGYEQEELPVLHLADLFAFGDRQRLTQNFHKRLRGDPFWDHEYIAQRKNGTTFPILVYSAPIIQNSIPVGLRAVVVDITERQRAEQALQEGKAKLESIFESSPNAICVTDLNCRLTDCNQATLETYGYSAKDELLGHSLFDLIAERDRTKARETTENTVAEGLTKDVELTLLKKDRREFPGEISASLMRDPTGEPMGLVAAMADITERKKSEQALRESLQTSSDIVASIPSGLLIYKYTAPNTLKLVDGNQAATQLSGLNLPLHIGQTLDEIWPNTRKTGLIDEYLKVMETGLTFETEDFVHEDGKLSRIFSVRAFRIPGHRLCVAFENVTERRKAQQALQESERKLATLMANLPGMAYRCLDDGEWTMEFVSEGCAHLTGYASEDILGNHKITYEEIVHPDDRQHVHEKIKQALATHHSFEIEYRILTAQGQEKWVWERGRQVNGIDGPFPILEGFILDISERRSAEQQLQAYQKKLKSLASELSLAEERERRRMATGLHDHVCQNLVLSKMKLQSLSPSLPTCPAQAVEAVCQTLNETIQSVRELTFDLSSPILYKFGLVAALEELLKDKVRGEHHIHCQFTDDGQPKPLSPDVLVLLFQSVRELIINMIKHAQAHEVSLDIRREIDSIRIELTDDGIGFDVSEVLSFPSRKRSVGLFNILERLDYIGGQLDMESQPGCGSRFTLVAPLITEANVAKEPHDGSENSTR